MTRILLARICIDTDGMYSCDIPEPDQGGSYGIGTVSMGPDAKLQDILDLIHRRLLRPGIQKQIQQWIDVTKSDKA